MSQSRPTSLHADSSAGRGAASEEAAPFRLERRKPTACVYVDGFNLYYGALKDTPLRWLNPLALASNVFPAFDCIGCKYFSAPVSAKAGSSEQALRQSVYWRALRTIPSLEIIEGHFKVRRTWARSANPPPDMVEIIRAEEKGSDVNLASHLLVDAMAGSYDVALVISGDSDLVTPIGMLTSKFSRPVGVINPQRLSGPDRRRLRGSSQLKQVASYYRGGLTWAQLQRAMLPHGLSDNHGPISAPDGWTLPVAGGSG
jgi:uncharacterized LabA/DUF88 family protein